MLNVSLLRKTGNSCGPKVLKWWGDVSTHALPPAFVGDAHRRQHIGYIRYAAEGTRRVRVVRRSRPTPRRQPEHRSYSEERSGRQLCCGKVAERGRAASPTKAGGIIEKLREISSTTRVQLELYPRL